MPLPALLERLVPERAVRRYMAALLLLFAASFPAGLYASHPFLRTMAGTLVEMASPVPDMPGGSFFLLVLLNNVLASFLLLISGLLAGVLPALSVGTNGFLMGMICRHISGTAGPGAAALEMLPHAVFGIPALLVVAAYGVWLGAGVLRRLRGKEERTVSELVSRATEQYFALALPLMVAASAAETFLALRP